MESMLQIMGQSVSSRILKFKSRENKIYLSLFAWFMNQHVVKLFYNSLNRLSPSADRQHATAESGGRQCAASVAILRQLFAMRDSHGNNYDNVMRCTWQTMNSYATLAPTTPTYPKPAPSVVVCKHVRAKATASCQLRVESPQGHVAARQMGQRQQQQRQRPLVHAT